MITDMITEHQLCLPDELPNGSTSSAKSAWSKPSTADVKTIRSLSTLTACRSVT